MVNKELKNKLIRVFERTEKLEPHLDHSVDMDNVCDILFENITAAELARKSQKTFSDTLYLTVLYWALSSQKHRGAVLHQARVHGVQHYFLMAIVDKLNENFLSDFSGNRTNANSMNEVLSASITDLIITSSLNPADLDYPRQAWSAPGYFEAVVAAGWDCRDILRAMEPMQIISARSALSPRGINVFDPDAGDSSPEEPFTLFKKEQLIPLFHLFKEFHGDYQAQIKMERFLQNIEGCENFVFTDVEAVSFVFGNDLERFFDEALSDFDHHKDAIFRVIGSFRNDGKLIQLNDLPKSITAKLLEYNALLAEDLKFIPKVSRNHPKHRIESDFNL